MKVSEKEQYKAEAKIFRRRSKPTYQATRHCKQPVIAKRHDKANCLRELGIPIAIGKANPPIKQPPPLKKKQKTLLIVEKKTLFLQSI